MIGGFWSLVLRFMVSRFWSLLLWFWVFVVIVKYRKYMGLVIGVGNSVGDGVSFLASQTFGTGTVVVPVATASSTWVIRILVNAPTINAMDDVGRGTQ